MTLPRDTLLDLLSVATCAANLNERDAAIELLAHEQASRLAAGDRKYPPSHPALALDTFYPAVHTLDGLLYEESDLSLPEESRRPRVRFGQTDKRASFFQYYQSGEYPTTTTPQVPAPQASFTYATVLASVVELASQLRDRVVGDVGSTVFDDARAQFDPYFAAQDFAARQDVARYAVGGNARYDAGDAAPGAAFKLATRDLQVQGYTALSVDDTPAITVTTTDDYFVSFDGSVRSDSGANPTNVVVALYVNGSQVATRTVSRASASTAQFVRFSAQNQTLSLSAGDVLSIRNGGTANEYAAGALLVWRDP